MGVLARLWRRLHFYLRRRQYDVDLEEEMRFHLEMRAWENAGRGLPDEEARAAARRRFGSPLLVREQSADEWRWRWVDDLARDVRFGARMLRKSPGFTVVAVLSLALGIGANTALFSVADSVLLSTLPVREPDQLVLFTWRAGTAFRTTGTSGYGDPDRPPGTRGSSSFHYRIFETLRAQDGPLSDLTAFASMWNANVSVDGEAEMTDGQYVAGNYFAMLGVSAAVGRMLSHADDAPGASPAAVISHRFWQTRFGEDPAVVGRQVVVNNVAFTIVGVTPPAFTGAGQVGARPVVFVPIAFEPVLAVDDSNMPRPDNPGIWWVHLMGRLDPGATAEQARASLEGAFQTLALEMMPPPEKESDPATLDAKDYPRLLANPGGRGMTETRKYYTSTVYLLFGVVALVLLIACANVANMVLARAAARGSEITVRLAMGAGRWRLVRQLMAESLLLSALGGGLGVVFAYWGTVALGALGEPRGGFLPGGVEYTLSPRVLAFSFAVSVLTGVAFGLAPALRASRLDLTTAMKDGRRGSVGASRSRLSRALVVAQVAMSLVLLVGAGLFVRTVHNLQQVDVGFNQENLLVFSLRPGSLGYEGERLEQLYRQLFARLDTLAGVQSATFHRIPLLANNINSTSLILPGETVANAAERSTNIQIVRENYFETLEIPLLSGRGFTERDAAAAPRVAIVSEALARRFFPDQDPIGQRVGFDKETLGQIEIVGIARDTKYNSPREEIEPLVYMPWLQQTDRIGGMSFAVRAADPTALAPAVREVVRQVEPALPVTGMMTQEAQTSGTFAAERTFADLLTLFGLLAVLLAAIGLYGVLAYSVAQRTHEIGIRMALGARVATILGMVIGQGMALAGVGLVAGAAAAYALKRVVEEQLYGVDAADPVTFAVVGAALLGVALLACWIPARRAAGVDPAVALRSE
jgi:predicted permease